MSYSKFQITPIKGEVEFQNFCLKLARREWNDKHAQLNGRRGQGQHGVDINGQDNTASGEFCGVQCKGSEKNAPRRLTKKEVQDEVDAAKQYKPPLSLLIIAYAGDRDKNLQEQVRLINVEHKTKDLFRVVLRSWDDILDELEAYPDLQGELLAPLVLAEVPTRSDVDPKRPRSGSSDLGDGWASEPPARSAHFSVGSEAANSEDATANAKLDLLRDQVLAGDAQAALKALARFVEEVALSGSERVKFRAHANYGSALMRLERYDEAAVQFEISGNIEGDTADGHAYLANVAQIRGDGATAYQEAKRAIELDSGHALASALLIESAPKEISPAQLEGQIGPVLDEIDVGWALARRYAEVGLYADSMRAAEQIAEKEEAWARDIVIGEAILSSFEDDEKARIGAPLDEEKYQLIEKAERHLRKGWETVKSRGDGKLWAHVGANLSVALRLAGKVSEADQVAIEAYELNPGPAGIRARAALSLMHQGMLKEAAELAKSVAKSDESEDLLFAAGICATADQYTDVLSLSEKAFAGCSGAERGRAAELIILATAKTNSIPAAIERAKKVQEDIGPNIAFLSRLAELARRAEDVATLEGVRLKLAEFDCSGLSELERFELSEALADDAQWSSAADLLDGLYTLDRPSELLRRRLFLLYRADRRREARDLYRSLFGPALKSPEIRRLGAAIFERSGMLDDAVVELSEALKLDSNDLRSRLDWVKLQLRNGQERTVERWIKAAPINVGGAPEEVLEFAQVLDRFGRRQDALRIGYETVRRNWGKREQAHTMYMSLFLLRGTQKEEFLFPTEVSVDTVVFIDDQHGEKRRYRIEDWPEVDDEVLSPDHAFAKALMGHGAGDVVTFARGLGEATDWKIVELKHKYLDLFHRVMEEHETLFPDNQSFTRFRIDTTAEVSFEPVFEQVRARARWVDEVSKQYKEKNIPVDLVGSTLGIDTIDASLGLRFNSNIRLQSCVGSPAEKRTARSAIKSAQGIILDPLTLAFWQDIGLLAHLENHPSLRLEVVQSTIDALASRVEEARLAESQEGGSLTANGEMITLIDIPKDIREHTLCVREFLLAWVRKHCRLIPTETLSLPEEKALVSEVLSAASFDAICTAARAGKLLLSEDLKLRNLAKELCVQNTAWTQPLLMELHDLKDISDIEYARLLASMHQNKLQFVSVGVSDLLASAKEDPEIFEHLLAALSLPNVEPGSLIVVSSQFCEQLWVDPSCRAIRERRTSQMFWALLMGRPDGLSLVKVLIREVSDLLGVRRIPDSFSQGPWNSFGYGFFKGHFLLVTGAQRRTNDPTDLAT